MAVKSRKKAKDGELYIELDGTKYQAEGKTISREDVIRFIEEFNVGKYKVYQEGIPVRPSQLIRTLPVKIVREDKAAN